MILIIGIFSVFGCGSSSLDEKYVQISKTMTRTQVIEIMGQLTSTETLRDIEILTYEFDYLNRSDYYVILIDDDTKKVMESTHISDSAPDKFIEKWKWYLARKTDKILKF